MKKFILYSFLFSFCHFANASETKSSSWLGTFANKKIGGDFSFWMETQVRYNFDLGGTGQILYRTGILQKLTEKQGLGYLYAYIQSSSLKEHRFALQHTLTMNSSFSHRVRLEGRFMEDDLENAGRFRYLLRYDRPLSDKKRLAVWDEAFINLNETSWNGDRSFDRNRFFLGLRFKFQELDLEVGYHYQFVPRDSWDINEHVAVAYFFI